MTKDEAIEQLSGFFDPYNWRRSKDEFYSLGTYAFGATIEPVRDKFLVRVGYSIGWGQDPGELLAKIEFDTLEEAQNFGMLIYMQNKPHHVDRTVLRKLKANI